MGSHKTHEFGKSKSNFFQNILQSSPGMHQELGNRWIHPDKFNISDWADCLAGLLDAVKINHSHILGLSWGGLLAQEFYHLYPTRVLSLILADTYAGWTGSLSDSIVKMRLEGYIHDSELPPAEFVPKYLSAMFSDSVKEETKEELSKIMSGTHPKGFRLMATALSVGDTRSLLPCIKVPVLLIWGESDKRSPINIARQMHSSIPGARIEIIAGAGHASNMERPERFNEIVKEFCSSIKER